MRLGVEVFILIYTAESGSEPKPLTARQIYIVGRFGFLQGHTLTRNKTVDTMADESPDNSPEQQVMNTPRLGDIKLK